MGLVELWIGFKSDGQTTKTGQFAVIAGCGLVSNLTVKQLSGQG